MITKRKKMKDLTLSNVHTSSPYSPPFDNTLTGVPLTPLIQVAIQSIENTCNKPTQTINFPNQNKYEGGMLKGVPHGVGEMSYACGTRYIGEFANGMRYGHGTFYFLDGSKYVGNFLNDKRHGRGAMQYSNGDYYEGEFSNDIRHGQGTMHHRNGDKYTGQYMNDEPHGEGSYEYKDGSHYSGTFENNQFIHGILTLSNNKKFLYSPRSKNSLDGWHELV
jgi:hypothetical protein